MTSDRQKSIDALYVVVTAADRAVPGRIAELEAEARASGRTLLHQPEPSHYAKRIDAALVREAVPIIDRSDDRSFLANLDKIASGTVRIK